MAYKKRSGSIMRVYNLLNYQVEVEKSAFLNAINVQKPIAITLFGEISKE